MLSGLRDGIAARGPFFVATGGFLLACLLFGGGTHAGFLSDTFIQLLAIPLLLVGLWRCLDMSPAERPGSAMRLALAIAAVPALQLIPLPPQLRFQLPGSQLAAELFALLGDGLPWGPISVSPSATWLSLISLLPPIAVFLAVALAGFRERRMLSLIVVGVGAVSVLLGLAQVAQGQDSQLRFFQVTNATEAVGFFANRNHFAALLYVTLLLTAAWGVHAVTLAADAPKTRRFEAGSILPTLAAFTLLVALLAGQIAARSRAGIGLTMIALIAAFALAISDRRTVSAATPARLLLGLSTIAGVLIAQFALYRVFERFAVDHLADARIPFARNTIEAAGAFFPLGAGMGTFVPVYAAFEKAEQAFPNVFANHAHNDFVELWLEAGVLGVVVAMVCAIWLLLRVLRLWRAGVWGGDKIDLLLARAASLSVLLLALHSLFDYPLRTSAMTSLLAFCCGLLVTPPGSGNRDEEPEAIGRPEQKTRGQVAAHAPVFDHEMPQTGSVASGQRWGKGIDWPDAWGQPSPKGGKRDVD